MTWDDHKKNFARLARDGGYTIAQYAAEFNLNPNTARRYLRAFKEDTRTADSRKPNKPVRKPLKSMIIDHSNDQHAGDHIAAEIAEKQRVNAVVSAAVENAKRQNKRINDRSDDHDVITRAHRTLRDRLERDTLDDDGERFEFEAGDYLIDNVEARKAARAMLRRSGADVLETTLLEKSLSHLLMLENARDTCIRLVQEMRDQQKDDDEGTPPEYRIASMLNSCSAQISSLINTIYSIRNNYRKASREAEKHALSMGQAGIVKLAYERKRENNWSVLEAAEFIEAHGGKVPPLMLEQIKADLRAPKTNTDDEERQTAVGGPSLEDLDKVARERAANRRADAALWIEQRREEIADIVDTGGYGDVDTEGVSNDPWLEQDLDEDEEEDEEVTRKLDGDGLGKATADLMYEYYGITVQRIRWGKKMHSREDKSLYFDKRAYANVQAAEAVKSGRMRLDKGNETIEEASKIPVGINSAGQWKVMSKEDMKKKLNLHSPDHWDTYCFAMLADYVPQDEVLSVEDEAQVDEALAWLNE
ncbi:TPA: terminase [Escherichia coli]